MSMRYPEKFSQPDLVMDPFGNIIDVDGVVVTPVREVLGGSDRRRVAVVHMDKSMTQQQFLKDTDINEIVRRNPDITSFGINDRPMFGDFSAMPSFHDAMNTVTAARQMFDELPSELRARFDNDPHQLMQFMADEANYDEAVKLGICKATPEAPGPVEVRVVEPAKPATDGG